MAEPLNGDFSGGEDNEDDEKVCFKSDIAKKISKIKRFSKSTNPYFIRNCLQIFCASIFFLLVSMGDFILNSYMLYEISWLTENQRIIGLLKIDVNF